MNIAPEDLFEKRHVGVSKQELSKAQKQAKLIEISLPEEKFENEMYIDPVFSKKMKEGLIK